jgi:Ni/Co efflux regulator RcnB
MASSRALALARDAVAAVLVVASMARAHRAATSEDRQSSSPHGDRDGDASRLDRRRRAESVPLASASQGASVFVVVVARERERERCDDRR